LGFIKHEISIKYLKIYRTLDHNQSHTFGFPIRYYFLQELPRTFHGPEYVYVAVSFNAWL